MISELALIIFILKSHIYLFTIICVNFTVLKKLD